MNVFCGVKREFEFEWDSVKAETNFRKHGIRFEEAALVFDDPFHLSVKDRFENGEYRWQTIGTVKGYVVVLVAHTIRFEDGTEIIRIISARKAERNERKRYEHG
ncbi:BrnT family toxin [Xenorhabdus kozodoii]|uniref:BrnT family toxin n=1 Tax=Xenorhabdus kozodoii TaxID=351676 RepID=UPI000C04D42E|nr:BrnT family toxin [Xenorhabdus kozodoii]